MTNSVLDKMENIKQNRQNSLANKSWLLRLFESKMFDASMAVHYLFNSKEPGVLSYLGNRLFTLNDEEVRTFSQYQ